jgi:hypothetical protein
MSTPPGQLTGYPPPYGPDDGGPGPGAPGRGWMIAFFTLLMLVVVAAVISYLVLRDSGGSQVAPRIDPATIDFGDQDLGRRSAVQTVTLTSGSDSVRVASIGIEGAQATDFRITEESTCAEGRTVAAGSACTIGVRFRPRARAPRSAQLVVRLEGGEAPLRVALHGTGVGAAAVVVETTRLDLGRVLVGKSRTRTVGLTNAGNAPLAITDLSIEGDGAASFRIARKPTTCSLQRAVPAGGSCTIAVAFSPAATGPAAATLSIAHDAPGSPSVVDLRGTGTGMAAPELSKSSLTFGQAPVGASSKAQTVTLTNAGTGAVTLASLTIAGSNTSDFALTPATGCREGLRLEAGDSCTIEVVFSPTAEGDRSATLEIRSSKALIASLELNGTGVQPPG